MARLQNTTIVGLLPNKFVSLATADGFTAGASAKPSLRLAYSACFLPILVPSGKSYGGIRSLFDKPTKKIARRGVVPTTG